MIFIVYTLTACIIIIFDQIAKMLVNKNIAHRQKKALIKGKVYITNIKNKGAAYGILRDSPYILAVLSCFTLIAVLYNFIMALYNDSPKAVKLGLAFILGGGVGNIIDRAIKKEVTDYIRFNNDNIPVFNLADLFVLFGIIILYVKQAMSE